MLQRLSNNGKKKTNNMRFSVSFCIGHAASSLSPLFQLFFLINIRNNMPLGCLFSKKEEDGNSAPTFVYLQLDLFLGHWTDFFFFEIYWTELFELAKNQQASPEDVNGPSWTRGTTTGPELPSPSSPNAFGSFPAHGPVRQSTQTQPPSTRAARRRRTSQRLAEEPHRAPPLGSVGLLAERRKRVPRTPPRRRRRLSQSHAAAPETPTGPQFSPHATPS